MQRKRSMEYVVEPNTPQSGERYVPVSTQAAACFQRIISKRILQIEEPLTGGYTGFLILDLLLLTEMRYHDAL